MFRFESPWMFLLLTLIPAVFWLRHRGGPRAALRFSSTAPVARLGKSWKQQLIALPEILRVITLVLFVIALARPQLGTERVLDTSRGIAIEMVIDRSSSMAADFRFRGRKVNRLDVALQLFEDFVKGGSGELEGRPADLIGLITFARYADTICPLTLAHDTVAGFLPTVKLVQRREEDGTAIGDAVALAAARLKTAEDTLNRQSGGQKDYEIKSKVIIILTDGENNAGERSVEEAAKLAAGWGIKIYAIGIGGGGPSIQTPFGSFSIPGGQSVDEEAIRTLAETTNGLYRVAEDAEALQAVYEEIDKLEKSEIESTRYMDYRERFTPIVAAALAFLVLELLLSATIFRRIP